MKPKICIVSYRFPPEYTGAGKRAAEFAEYLFNNGYQVTVISSKNDPITPNNLSKFTVLYYTRNNFRFPFKGIVESFGLLLTLFRNRKFYNEIFVYADLCLAASFLKLLKKKIIYRATLMDVDDFPCLISHRYFGWYFRILCKMIDYHWVISKEMQEGLTEIGIPDAKIIYSPNGVILEDERDTKNLLKDMQNNNEKINFLFIGEISYRKGADLFIKLFPRILKRYPVSQLNICGPIGSQDLYRKLIKLPNTSYYGVVDDVCKIIEQNDFFLFPTRKEGFPTALIEAMSRGLICITSKLPVIENEIIDHNVDGYCIDFQDKKGAVQLISCLIEDKNLRDSISKNAIVKIKKKFLNLNNFEKVIKKVLE